MVYNPLVYMLYGTKWKCSGTPYSLQRMFLLCGKILMETHVRNVSTYCKTCYENRFERKGKR